MLKKRAGPGPPRPETGPKFSAGPALLTACEYLGEKTHREHSLDYWNKVEVGARYPILQQLARQFHTAPATSAESERQSVQS